ncbi:hypothetical protein SNE40_021311 [Patella caerulea]|uniref:Centrobin n=1 Tax=Patella caerulea TaxID=87958 RepID=A0AAN8FZ75_PATCE
MGDFQHLLFYSGLKSKVDLKIHQSSSCENIENLKETDVDCNRENLLTDNLDLLKITQSQESVSVESENIVQQRYIFNMNSHSVLEGTESDVDSGLKTASRSFLSCEMLSSNLNQSRVEAGSGESPLLPKSPKVTENLADDITDLFTPMKTLNFNDATDSDIQQHGMIDEEYDDYTSVEANGEKIEFISTNSQGVRIIEGHASPLEDKTNQALGFNFQNNAAGFLASQDNHADIFAESPNLYDSLEEHEDGDVPCDRNKHSPHRTRYSPAPNPVTSPRNCTAESIPEFNPQRSKVSQDSMSEGSPGEIRAEQDMLQRSIDNYQYSFSNHMNTSHASISENLLSLDGYLTEHGLLQGAVGTSLGSSHLLKHERSMPPGLQNYSTERQVPTGLPENHPNRFQHKNENGFHYIKNGKNVSSEQIHCVFSPKSDPGSHQTVDDHGNLLLNVNGDTRDDTHVNSNISDQEHRKLDEFHSLPDLTSMRCQEAASKTSLQQPQKPNQQNLANQNQKAPKLPTETKVCSQHLKHEQRQNINNSSGTIGKTKPGMSSDKQNVSARYPVHPKTRPNAQGGNVQEKQNAATGNTQPGYNQTSQRSFNRQTDTSTHGRQILHHSDQTISHSTRGSTLNRGAPRTGNDINYENRIAGVGQDDIISRSDFTRLPDSDNLPIYRQDRHHVASLLQTGRGQQREATVGYQNNDQYVPMYANSYNDTDDIANDDRPSPRSRDNSTRGQLKNDTNHRSHVTTRSPQQQTVSEDIFEGGGGVNVDIMGMEEVRSHLHSVLRAGNSHLQGPPSIDASISPSELLMEHPAARNRSIYTSGRMQDEVPDIFENFPSFSSKIFTELNGSNVRSELSTQNENQYIRDALEREHYRRKHCEEQIQQLNSKLLETQQQLAIAISTDKKKDIMIEQLDKQLAKVVEGWKRRETEKDEYLKVLTKEKRKVEDQLQKQQVMISNLEKNKSDTLDELHKEKNKHVEDVERLETRMIDAIREKKLMEEELNGEKEKSSLITQEWEQLKESRELSEKRAQVAQDRLHHEQDEFYRREQELLTKIDEVKDANLKVIQMERRKTEEEQGRISELEDKIRTLTTETKKLGLSVDSANREKESLKVEMSIMEAKYESAARKLEADLQSQMEKEISEQIEDITEKMESTVTEIQEKHRQQVMELQKRQQKDLEQQLHEFHEQVLEKEKELQKQIVDGENQLREFQKENTSLKNIKQKLESQRMEILTKLQYMMQSQWNEAVSLLVNTPHRRRQMSAVSSINPSQIDDNNGVGQGLNLSMMTQGSPKTSSPGRDKLATNFGLYVETEGGVSGRPHPPHTQTARVEAYLNTMPTTSGVTSHQLFKPASHSLPVSHNQPSTQHPMSSPKLNSQHLSYSNASSRGQGQSSDIYHTTKNLTTNCNRFDVPNLFVQSSPKRYTRPQSTESFSQGVKRSQYSHQPDSSECYQQRPSDMISSRPEVNISLTEDPDADLINTLYHANLPSDSQLHHLLNQRIEAYLTNQNSALSAENAPAVMIRPPHQQNRPMNGQNYNRSSNHSEAVSPKYRADDRVDAGQQDNTNLLDDQNSGHLTLQDLHSLSPPVTTDHTDSIGAHSEEGETTPVDTVRLKSDYGQLFSQVEEYQWRQTELQHYIKKLLEKSPRSDNDEPVPDLPVDSEIDTSRDLAVDFDLNDTEQAAQLSQDFHRLQQLREKQSVSGKLIGSLNQDSLPVSQGSTSLPGVIPPEQMLEISLLSQYQQPLHHQQSVNPITTTTSTALTSLLVSALQTLPNRSQTVKEGKTKPNVKYSPKSSQTRKQKEVQKHIHSKDSVSTQGGGVEKPNGSNKTDKKTVAVKPSQHKNKFWK